MGTNNINLLYPSGMFGTRLLGGKDAASPRYIFTRLAQVTRALFPEHDDALLEQQVEDGDAIEPKTYVPIIPLILCNGADGIGTGYSTFVPQHNPADVIACIRAMLANVDIPPIKPWYRGFTGEVEVTEGGFETHGTYEWDGRKLTITELPLNKWTSPYKEFLDTVLRNQQLKGKKKQTVVEEALVRSFEEHHSDTTVKFVVSLTDAGKAYMDGDVGTVRRVFRLSSKHSTRNMMAFNARGMLVRYDDVPSILREFYTTRMELYGKRREALLAADRADLELQAAKRRFILLVIEGDLVIARRPKAELEEDLASRDFVRVNGAYDHLLGMKLWSLTAEKVAELESSIADLEASIASMEGKTPADLWREDLDVLEEKLEAAQKEFEELATGEGAGQEAKPKKRRRVKKKTRAVKKTKASAASVEH